MKGSENIIRELRKYTTREKAKTFARFFKTGKGQYGEGDVFLGVPVPKTREIIKRCPVSDLLEIQKLILSKYHEARLAGVLLLVATYRKSKEEKDKKKIFDFYIKNSKLINNWDLVDSSAHYIVGAHLEKKPKDILYRFAKSENLWQRRISIISTYFSIKNGYEREAFKIARMLFRDEHDLIHKAVGWMLREVGKNCGEEKLERFLRENIENLPRTSLRYAIERMPPSKRKIFLNM